MADLRDNNDILLTLMQQQAETQRFLGRIESSLEAIQHQYSQTNDSMKSSFETLNDRITDTNTMLSGVIKDFQIEKDNQHSILKQLDSRIEIIEKDKEHTKGVIYGAKIILGIIGTILTAVVGFLVNIFFKGAN